MTFPTRIQTLTLALLLATAGPLAAQEDAATTTAATETTSTSTATATTAAPATTTATQAGEDVESPSSRTVREQLNAVLNRYPPVVGTILSLDPTLLSEPAFLSRYPDLQKFVTAHPEIRHHARYYLADVDALREPPARPRNPVEESIETLLIILVFSLIALALGWFIRTFMDYKRLNHLQRAQADVHNRIMDRFGTSDELLQYIKTPAGSKYLEFQPIPLHAEPPKPPLTRAMWSIQIGVVVGAAAIGMLLLSAIFSGESRQGFFAMGTIGAAVGIGFIGSAAVSILLSRRLGLWAAPPADADPRTLNDRGIV